MKFFYWAQCEIIAAEQVVAAVILCRAGFKSFLLVLRVQPMNELIIFIDTYYTFDKSLQLMMSAHLI